MEMSKGELDKYVVVEDGEFKDIMYKINGAKFKEVDNHDVLQLDYDVLNLPEGKERDFEQYLGEFVIRALEFAVKNDPEDGNAI